MSANIVCPQCRATLKANTPPAAGTRLKCPKCASEFRYSPQPSAPATVVAPPPLPPAAARPAPLVAAPQVSPPKRAGGNNTSSSVPLVLGGLAIFAIVAIGLVIVAWNWNSKETPQAAATKPQSAPTTAPGTLPSAAASNGTQPIEQSSSGGNESPVPVGTSAAEKFPLPDELKLRDDESALGIAISPDGRGVAAATSAGLTLWDLNTGKERRLEHFSNPDNCRLYYSPSGQHVAMVSRDVQTYQLLRGAVWSLADDKKVVEFEYPDAPNGFELAVAFSPRGTYFAAATSDHGIVVTNLAEGRTLRKLVGHTASVGALLFSGDEKSLFSGSRDVTDGTTRQWNLETPGESRLLARGQAVTALAATPDGRTLVTGGFGTVQQWDIRGTGLAALKHKIPETATTLLISADSRTLRLVADSQAASWDLIDGKIVGRKLSVSINRPDEFLFSTLSPDGRMLCVASRNALALWDVASAQRRTEYPNPGNSGYLVGTAISSDGALLAAAYQGGTIKLIPLGGSVASAAGTLTLKSGVRGLKYSADGKTLAIDLIPNAMNKEDPALAVALREGEEAFSSLDRKLNMERASFREKRDAERKALIQRIQGDKSLAVEQMVRKRDQALVEFDRETKALLKERFGLAKQGFLAELCKRLAEKHAAEFPWGEMAAIWKIGDPQPSVVLAEPPLARDEFPTDESDPSSVGLPAVLDPAGPLGAGNLSILPPVALQATRLTWVHRQSGIVSVNLDSREPTSFGQANLEILSWLLSPDGKTLFIKGNRKVRMEVMKTSPGGVKTTEIKNEVQPVCAFLDLETKNLRPLPVDRLGNTFLDACFTPDGKRLLAKTEGTALEQQSRQLSIRQWEVATGTEVGEPILFPAGESLREMVVSPDGKLLAVVRGTQNMNLHLVDLATGQERPTTLPEHVALPTFSPDSRTLAMVVTGYNLPKHQIELIDVASGQSRASVAGWNSYVQAIAFSPDSRTLAIGGGSREGRDFRNVGYRLYPAGLGVACELKLIDADKGTVLAPLAGHDDLLTCLEFSPDGGTLASGGADRSVRLWDVAASIKAGAKPAASAAVSPAPMSPAKANPKATASTAKTTAMTQRTTGSPAAETNSIGMKLVVLPAGEFVMGSPESDTDADAGERPQHTVRLTKPFAIGIHEVTVGQFRAFVDATGYQTDGENAGGGCGYDAASRRFIEELRPEFTWKNIGTEQTDEHPVTNVSWNDAKAFCTWLSTKEGKRYRLPTEAEWEYACRAGTKTRFPTGDNGNTLKGTANVGDSSLRKSWPAANWTIDWDDGYPFTAPVGSFKANAWGIHDMIGNVSEWCEDRFDPAYYASSPDTDPRGPTSGEFRVVRAGGWYNEPPHQRCASRGSPDWPPWARSVVMGFRVVHE